MTTSSLSSASTTTLASNPLISSQSGSSSSSTSTSTGLNQLDYNFNEFLTLFTTQLQNQDPTNPMDTSQMTNQLAMFSEVEQTAGVNSRLDKILAAQTTSTLSSAVGYMGHGVQATGDQVALTNGSATIDYNMPSSATSATITVTDSSGNTVTTLSGGSSAGNQSVTWNGTDSSGNTVSDGAYTIAVTANNGTGPTVTPTTYTTGKVTGVETSNGSTMLNLGNGITVNTTAVVAITS